MFRQKFREIKFSRMILPAILFSRNTFKAKIIFSLSFDKKFRGMNSMLDVHSAVWKNAKFSLAEIFLVKPVLE